MKQGEVVTHCDIFAAIIAINTRRTGNLMSQDGHLPAHVGYVNLSTQ